MNCGSQDIFEQLASRLEGREEICIVYDRNVAHLLKPLRQAIGNTPKIVSVPFTATENNKTLSSAGRICRAMMKRDFGRGAFLLALGGGLTSDVAGFAASIYKRGIAYGNLPTTLLSMVDAGVGGKTAVNFCSVKNSLGTFHQPEFTINIPQALGTLTPAQLRSGAAEMLKTFIIADAAAYREAVALLKVLSTSQPNALSGPQPLFQPLPQAEVSQPETTQSQPQPQPQVLLDSLVSLAGRAAEIKMSIVRQDPTEKGLRRVLNLGHTLGHALEVFNGFSCSHGDCVAVGIVESARLSEKMGLASKGLADSIASDFRACGLPTNIQELLLLASPESLPPVSPEPLSSADPKQNLLSPTSPEHLSLSSAGQGQVSISPSGQGQTPTSPVGSGLETCQPSAIPVESAEALLKIILNDKKASRGLVAEPLVEQIGKVTIREIDPSQLLP